MKRLFTTLSLLSLVLLLTPPRSAQAAPSDKADLSDKLTGRILLQVEDKGQAYYVDSGMSSTHFLDTLSHGDYLIN